MITVDDLVAKIGSGEVRRAFEFLQGALSSSGELTCEPEKHGYMASLRIRRGSDWSFSASPAANWLLFYIRKPELKRGRITFDGVRERFPEAVERKDGEVTVRLMNEEMARRMVSLIASAG